MGSLIASLTLVSPLRLLAPSVLRTPHGCLYPDSSPQLQTPVCSEDPQAWSVPCSESPSGLLLLLVMSPSSSLSSVASPCLQDCPQNHSLPSQPCHTPPGKLLLIRRPQLLTPPRQRLPTPQAPSDPWTTSPGRGRVALSHRTVSSLKARLWPYVGSFIHSFIHSSNMYEHHRVANNTALSWWVDGEQSLVWRAGSE